jgi:D-alanine--poly(phosphoribitol) ligase subunit 1
MNHPLHLLDRIDRWAELSPERIAFWSGSRTLSWAALVAQSDALALWLEEQLEGKPGPVAVHGHKEPEMLVTFLAAAKCGRAYVPMDVNIPEQRIAKIVAGSGAALVLTPERVREILEQLPAAVGRNPSKRVGAADPFYILFTSGSTGEPKGVVITLRNLEVFTEWMFAEQGFESGAETFLNQAPFSFDLSVMDVYCSLLSGGTIVCVTKEELGNLKALYARLAESGVTTWVSTPSFAQMCMIEKGFRAEMMPSLKRFLFCGETLAPETASQILERFPQVEVWNTYGPTEATVAATSVRVDRPLLEKYSPLPVGHPIPGTRVLAVDEALAPVAEGERGEILIAGPNVSPGYLQRPELTSKVFTSFEGLPAYRTGDWGRVRDGMVFFEGRMDGQIKLHGYRIELGDMEANLHALSEVADAVVLPVEKLGKVDSLAAFIVLAGEKQGSDFEVAARLKTRLGERLPAYMIPRKFVFLEAFPMTPNGKADRRALAALLG